MRGDGEMIFRRNSWGKGRFWGGRGRGRDLFMRQLRMAVLVFIVGDGWVRVALRGRPVWQPLPMSLSDSPWAIAVVDSCTKILKSSTQIVLL